MVKLDLVEWEAKEVTANLALVVDMANLIWEADIVNLDMASLIWEADMVNLDMVSLIWEVDMVNLDTANLIWEVDMASIKKLPVMDKATLANAVASMDPNKPMEVPDPTKDHNIPVNKWEANSVVQTTDSSSLVERVTNKECHPAMATEGKETMDRTLAPYFDPMNSQRLNTELDPLSSKLTITHKKESQSQRRRQQPTKNQLLVHLWSLVFSILATCRMRLLKKAPTHEQPIFIRRLMKEFCF
jgi:hypothetical protein